MKEQIKEKFKSGHIALIGRPNVGKSTLLNHILGQKLAITSRKPQTTRQTLLGIYTNKNMQMVFVDTPGIHKEANKKINQLMNKNARQSTAFVDLIVHISDATSWTFDDDYVLDFLKTVDVPVIHVLNKIDLLKESKDAIPITDKITKKFQYKEIVPVSAVKKVNTDHLIDVIGKHLPLGELIYPEDQVTTASMRFLAAEVVREKLFKVLHKELPYSIAVVTEQYIDSDDVAEIHVNIYITRNSQKPIVIGKGGKTLKYIGIKAREEIERLIDKKVRLHTWVKVKENWMENSQSLRQFGLHDNL